MTSSLNCNDAGDPVCTHTMHGETAEELLANAKKHGMEVHGYTEETWNVIHLNRKGIKAHRNLVSLLS